MQSRKGFCEKNVSNVSIECNYLLSKKQARMSAHLTCFSDMHGQMPKLSVILFQYRHYLIHFDLLVDKAVLKHPVDVFLPALLCLCQESGILCFH